MAKKAAKEVSDAQQKAAKETADAQKKAAKEASDAAKKAAKEVLANEKSTAAERKTAEDTLHKWSVREYKDRVSQQIREAKRLASEEARAAVQAQQAKKAAAAESAKAWEAQNASIMGSVKSIALFSAGMVGLNSVGSVLHMIVEQFNAVRLAGIKAAADILDEALDLRQLGALQGEMGQPSQQLMQQLEFRTKTLQTAGEARALTTEAMASGFGAIQAGLVTAPEFQKHLITSGQLSKMTGAEPGAVGKMSGILPMVTGKKKNTAEDLDVLMERLYEEQKLGGFKDYGQFAEQFAGSAEYVMKGVFNAPTLAALQAAFAKAGQGATASERVSQVTTAVSAGVLRNKGMKVNPDYENLMERSGEYFKKLGVTPNTKTEDRIMAVVNDLLKQEDVTLAAGKNWNPMDYLLEKGFINVQSRESLAKLAGVERTGGQLSELLGLGAKPLPATSGIGEKFRASKAGDITMAREEARAIDRAKQFRAGLGEKGEGLFRDAMLEKAYTSKGGEAYFGSGNTLDVIKGRAGLNPHEIWFGQREEVESEAQRMLLAEADKFGVKHADPFDRDLSGKIRGTRHLPWTELFSIGQKTREAGGTLTPEADLGTTNGLLADIKGLLKLTVQPPGGPPAPVGAPARPGAGPVGPAARDPDGAAGGREARRMSHTYTSNAAEIGQHFVDQIRSFGFTSTHEGKALGEVIIENVIEGIRTRTIDQQLNRDGEPLPPNSDNPPGKGYRSKKKEKYGVELTNVRTGHMLGWKCSGARIPGSSSTWSGSSTARAITRSRSTAGTSRRPTKWPRTSVKLAGPRRRDAVSTGSTRKFVITISPTCTRPSAPTWRTPAAEQWQPSTASLSLASRPTCSTRRTRMSSS